MVAFHQSNYSISTISQRSRKTSCKLIWLPTHFDIYFLFMLFLNFMTNCIITTAANWLRNPIAARRNSVGRYSAMTGKVRAWSK